MLRRLRRVPLPLALILTMAVVQGVTWSVVMPALQGPDEVSHFSYVQRIVERGEIPWQPGGESGPPSGHPYSAEIVVALDQSGLGPLAGNLGARPYWTQPDVDLWSRVDAELGSDARTGGGFTSALKNPPLYYLYETVPYGLLHGGSFFDRQLAMRLWNIPLLVALLVFAWLIIGELAGRGWPQVLGTAACALVPQLLNVTATVNPDLLLAAEWAAATWLMVLLLRRGPRPLWIGLLALLCVAGALTHARSIPLFVPAVIAVALSVAGGRGWRVSPGLVAGSVGGLYALVILVVSELGKGSVREFVSYVWQFYLPKLGFMTPKIGPEGYGFRDAFTERFYGTLAQLEVVLPSGVADWLHWISIIGLVVVIAALVHQRAAVRRQGATAWVLGIAIFALLLGLHIAAYRAMVNVPNDPLVTARYLLPVLPLFGLALVVIARPLPARARGVFAGLVLGTGVALQLYSIGLMVSRFYA